MVKYLVGTRDFSILFDQKIVTRDVMGYVDTDYVGDLDSRLSMTGFVFMYLVAQFAGNYSTGYSCFIHHRGRAYGSNKCSKRSSLAEKTD